MNFKVPQMRGFYWPIEKLLTARGRSQDVYVNERTRGWVDERIDEWVMERFGGWVDGCVHA
jgi:hypothetical protein